MDSSKLPVGL